MKITASPRAPWLKILAPITLAVIFGLALWLGVNPGLALSSAADPTAAQAVHDAWRNLQKSGEYHFATELEQIVWPAPKLTNVGRSSQRDTLYLEGQANLPQATLNIKLWENVANGDVFNPTAANGVEIRITGQTAEGRAIGSEQWQPVENIGQAFAPNGDAAAYLVGATNVRELPLTGEAGLAGAVAQAVAARRFTFDLDSAAFAQHIRADLENYLRSKGELPPGISLDSAELYQGMQGTGEVWVDATGLPARLQVNLLFPQQPNGQRVEANITRFRIGVFWFKCSPSDSVC